MNAPLSITDEFLCLAQTSTQGGVQMWLCLITPEMLTYCSLLSILCPLPYQRGAHVK